MFNRDIVILGMGKALQVVISLVSIRVLTTLLSEPEVGNYYLLLAIISLLSFGLLNPIGQYYSRHVLQWRDAGMLETGTVAVIAVRVSGAIVAMLVAAIIFELMDYSRYFELWNYLTLIFATLCAASSLVLLNTLNILGQRTTFIGYLLASLVLGLAFSVLFVWLLSPTGVGWLYGVAVAQLLLLPFLCRRLVRNWRSSLSTAVTIVSRTGLTRIAKFCVPVAITLFLQWGQNTSYRLIVEDRYAIEVLAYVAVGFSLSAAVFSAVEGLATQYFSPGYYRAITGASRDGRVSAWHAVAETILPVYISVSVMVAALSPFLMRVLVAEKFHEAYVYAAIGALVELLRATSGVVYLVSQSEMKTKETVLPYLLGFLVTVALLLLTDLSSHLWMLGVVLAGSQAIVLSALYLKMRQALPITFPWWAMAKSCVVSSPLVALYFLKTPTLLHFSPLMVLMGGAYSAACVYFLAVGRGRLGANS